MLVYGTAILAVCHLLGVFFGNLLGVVLGVQANVGGVAITMILLIISKEYLKKRNVLSKDLQMGILYWSGMYVPIVVAMAAGQDVVAAMSGGMVGLAVSVFSLIFTVWTIRILNKKFHESSQNNNETETA